MSGFKENVIAYVMRVPKGKVVSYGQVAAALILKKPSRLTTRHHGTPESEGNARSTPPT